MKHPFRHWRERFSKKDTPVGDSINPVGVTSALDVQPAAPSQKVGLEAHEGTGARFMSSDAAPALDQDISPTWTGTHDFTGSISVPTMDASDDSRHAASTAFVKAAVNTVPGSSAQPGDPTATVGLTAKKGTANTFMRSDAAPALDKSISPTWTEWHEFGKKITVPTMPESDKSTNAASTEFVHTAVQAATTGSSATGSLKVQYLLFRSNAVVFEATYKHGEFAYIARPGDIVQLEDGSTYKAMESTELFLNASTKEMYCVITLKTGP